MSEPMVNLEKLCWETGTLWDKITRQTESARQCGALKSIETEYQLIEQDNIPFIVRTLANIVRKELDKQQQLAKEAKTGKRINPFLPYDRELFVCDISPTHLCLLNKFNVVENHLLIVTRAFEEQTELLNLQDFLALAACMQEIDGLAFYNGGQIAGASQPHKHLQLIPLPLLEGVTHLPIETAIAQATYHNSIGRIDSFQFTHAIAKVAFSSMDLGDAARVMLDCYHRLLNSVGLTVGSQTQPSAYNFLATKNWILIVPRSQESFKSISVNSLGFAGSLFVRDRSSLELLKQITPMNILRNVAIAPQSHG
jgi:sulfate adenylyltransferase (ADP) / ATP adenylyltransferase